jgi:hypothetical protein
MDIVHKDLMQLGHNLWNQTLHPPWHLGQGLKSARLCMGKKLGTGTGSEMLL